MKKQIVLSLLCLSGNIMYSEYSFYNELKKTLNVKDVRILAGAALSYIIYKHILPITQTLLADRFVKDPVKKLFEEQKVKPLVMSGFFPDTLKKNTLNSKIAYIYEKYYQNTYRATPWRQIHLKLWRYLKSFIISIRVKEREDAMQEIDEKNREDLRKLATIAPYYDLDSLEQKGTKFKLEDIYKQVSKRLPSIIVCNESTYKKKKETFNEEIGIQTNLIIFKIKKEREKNKS